MLSYNHKKISLKLYILTEIWHFFVSPDLSVRPCIAIGLLLTEIIVILRLDCTT